eukprot:11167660-Lingulodinium_polyedra.AAC.1
MDCSYNGSVFADVETTGRSTNSMLSIHPSPRGWIHSICVQGMHMLRGPARRHVCATPSMAGKQRLRL